MLEGGGGSVQGSPAKMDTEHLFQADSFAEETQQAETLPSTSERERRE